VPVFWVQPFSLCHELKYMFLFIHRLVHVFAVQVCETVHHLLLTQQCQWSVVTAVVGSLCMGMWQACLLSFSVICVAVCVFLVAGLLCSYMQKVNQCQLRQRPGT
jgi:hypothetical protein